MTNSHMTTLFDSVH